MADITHSYDGKKITIIARQLDLFSQSFPRFAPVLS